jgi:tetratricopeptide (TPR) repeat protein
MQGDAGRHLEAMTTFSGLAATHEKDPRAWAALGGSHFYLGQYEPSLQALYHSRELVLAHYKEESAQHIVEVVHNIANVLILLGRYEDARAEINGLSPEEQTHPFIRALRGRLLMHEGQYSDALRHLKEAYEAGVDVSPSLVISLADCYRHLRQYDAERMLVEEAIKRLPATPEIWHRAAECFLVRREVAAAVTAMRRAVECSNGLPRYRAQLAALLHKAGHVKEGLIEARHCVALSAPTSHDRYYRGLAYYVLGKTAIAEDELAECRGDPVVSKWPHYSKVFDRKPNPSPVGS